MHITTLISAVITLLGALVVVIWMPGRRLGTPSPNATTAGETEAPAVAAGPVAVEG
jgi:hypothetical protein